MSQDEQNHPEPNEENPLLFWVAYLPAGGGMKNYLSNGKGNLRIFKTEERLREYIKPLIPPDAYELLVVHSVQGNIAIPEFSGSGTGTASTIKLPDMFDLANALKTPIRTLAPNTTPSAQELLEDYQKRARTRRKRVRRK